MIIVLTLILAFILQLFMPWWSVAIAAAVPALVMKQSGWKSFQNGFLGVFLLWTIWSGVVYVSGGDLLASRLATLFSLPSGWLTLVLTGLTGGLAAGLSAFTANRFRSWFNPFDM
jgi:hypothetical protein